MAPPYKKTNTLTASIALLIVTIVKNIGKINFSRTNILLICICAVALMLPLTLWAAPRLYGLGIKTYSGEVIFVDYQQNRAEDGHLYYGIRDIKTNNKYLINATSYMNGGGKITLFGVSCVPAQLKQGSIVEFKLPQINNLPELADITQFSTCHSRFLSGAYYINIKKDSNMPFPSDSMIHEHYDTALKRR